jgi:hypothetical protein
MIVSKNYGLAGKFKFDVYKKNGELKYTTDYIDNFITPTGLHYVKDFGYADCFRYLSIGSGTANNSITSNGGNGTTGLSVPLTNFSYLGGNLEGVSCFDGNTTNHYVENGCGYRIDPTGVTLYRAWRIPYEEDSVFSTRYEFQEYMLSPGRTGITGHIFNGADYDTIGSACSCQEAVYNNGGAEVAYYGREAPDFYGAYPFACNSTKAFSRIIKTVTVETEEYLVVNYALTVNLSNSTGIRPYTVSVSRGGSVGVTHNWVTASGLTSLVHPGIRLINDGTITNVSLANQIDGHVFRLGESFVPPLGIAMEPSCPIDNRTAYISTDNIQFRVNDMSGGAMILDTFQPHNPAGRPFPSGLIAFHKNYITETSNDVSSLGGEITSLAWCYRPRTDTWNEDAGSYYPSQSDYSTSVTSLQVTDSVQNEDTLSNEFKARYMVPNAVPSQTYIGGAMSSRSRELTMDFQYVTFSTIPTGMPVRAFVYGYKYLDGAGNNDWFATLDSIVAPDQYPALPPVNTAAKTYESPVAIKRNSISPGHYWMDTSNILQIQVKLNWSSPCPAGVEGC